MVRVEIFNSQREVIASVEANGDDLDIRGNTDIVDRGERHLGLRSRRMVAVEENAEDWARGLTISFRSVDLFARISHDDNPVDGLGSTRELGAVVC